MFPIIISFFLLPLNYGCSFAANRECMGFLFRAASETLLSWCEEEGFTSGFTAVMHTFGSVLEFHPHIHILLAEGGVGIDSDVWRDCRYFPHEILKKRFRYYLIKYLRDWSLRKLLSIPDSIRQIWKRKLGVKDFYSVSIKLYKIIWYVNIGERLSNASFTVGYIGRYAKRPCLSEAKIVYYSFERQVVSFIHKDKITGTCKKETICVEEFISRLIRHIPEKNFRLIRHYGFYSNRAKGRSIPMLRYQILLLFKTSEFIFSPKDQLENWRSRIKKITGKDPLVCPNCNIGMELVEIGYYARDGTLKIVNIS